MQMHDTASADQLKKQRAILAIIVVSYLMIVVDISIVITGLPRIQEGLGFSHAGLSWVQNAYTLAFGGLLLLGARAGDILGRRRMFIVGLGVFTLASLAIGAAPSAEWMLAARAIQGVGSAILAPSTLALLTTHFSEGPERTRALAYYAAAAGVGATVGLVLGGLLADLVSWRMGFFINLPIGLALMIGARRYIPECTKHRTKHRAKNHGQFDVLGAVSSTLGMTSLVYSIVRSTEQEWRDAGTLAALISGIALIVLFILHEARARQPILPLRLFASGERCGAHLARMLFLGGMVGFWFFSTQYLQEVMGYGPMKAGLAFLPVTLANFASAMLIPRLSRKFGNAGLLTGGLIISVAGLLWLGQVSAHTSYLTGIALPMILIGIGQGTALAPLTVFAVAGVNGKDAGAASGMVNVAHQLGASLGLGILVVVFASVQSVGLAGTEALAHSIARVFEAGAFMLALSLAVVLVSIVIPRRRLDKTCEQHPPRITADSAQNP